MSKHSADISGFVLKYVGLLFLVATVTGQTLTLDSDEDTIRWCTVSREEQYKCQNFSLAVKRDVLGGRFGRDARLRLDCKQAFDKEECMSLLDEGEVHITSLDAGQVFIGGRYHSLIPLMQETYEGGLRNYYSVAVVKKNSLPDVRTLRDLRGKKACFAGVGTQAGWVIPIDIMMKEGGLEIIDCNNHVKSAINYFGPSCAVDSLADKYNPIGDNSDKLCDICTGAVPGGKCTSADPYAGFEGAFKCLVEVGDIAFLKHTTVQEMTTSELQLPSVRKDSFELLCRDGSRRPVDDYRACQWGNVPSHAIVTSSAQTVERRRDFQKFLRRAVQLYGGAAPVFTSTFNRTGDQAAFGFNRESESTSTRNFNQDQFGRANQDFGQNDQFGNPRDQFGNQNQRDQFGNPRDQFGNQRDQFGNQRDQFGSQRDQFGRLLPDQSGRNSDQGRNFNSVGSSEGGPSQENFRIFESAPRYGIHHNLLFQDAARDLMVIEESRQTYSGYLGPALDAILAVRDCPVRRMTLCVTSDPEMEKCIKMRTALKAQLLKPEMSCYKGHSHIHCMQAIRNGDADVAVLDASDVYTGGLQYDLIPFIAEVYNLGKPEYYVVAVAREDDPSTELTYLKGKYTCHTGINTASGWVIPLAYLISNGWIRSYGCDSVRAAAEYFSKSCVPGALSTEYNSGVPYDNLCHLCHGSSYRYCRRDASEDYYGHTGAFRCLVEGGGDVAFVKHTTVMENTDGKRREWWARNTLTDDYELLCPDGTRAALKDYGWCNLGKVKANAIVARGGAGFNETELHAFTNLFVYAQQFYGRKYQDEFSFSMFYSPPPYSDLIFQDAAQQLKILPPEQRHFRAYLGREFMRARAIVDCHAGSAALASSLFLIVASTIMFTARQLLTP